MLVSKKQQITFETVAKLCNLPAPEPRSIDELIHLENIFDAMDNYLWLGQRFKPYFTDAETVQSAQAAIDGLIHECVADITKLLTEEQLSEMRTEATEATEKAGKSRTNLPLIWM